MIYWLYYLAMALCIAQFAVYFHNRYREKKFTRQLEAREASFAVNIAKFVKEMRGRDARSFMKWIDRKRYERLVGDQWINKETMQHVSLDEMIQQFVDETTVIEQQ